jgi:hypothetical protein
MKRVVILLILFVGFSGSVLVGSFFTSDKTKYANDFVRIFPPHAADLSETKYLGKNVSIAGAFAKTIFLKDRSVSDAILSVNWSLEDTMRIQVKGIADSEIFLDSPYFFLQSGHAAKLSRGHIEDWSIDTTFGGIPGFTAIQAIPGNSVVLRTIDLKRRKNVFVKSTELTAPHDILETQVDGILCTDGHLQYSKVYSRLVYTYSYRNQFLVLDTNLHVILKGKTIDTTSVARIAVKEMDGKITMSKPPFIVNQDIAVSGKYLFVNSRLVARNESLKDADNNSVIDVYNILDGSYRFSFYIKNIDGARMRTFIVQDLSVFAIFPQRISRYDIPPIYLRE